MTLPKVEYTTYKLKIPSNGNFINFRPMKVGEHKHLLQAVLLGDGNSFVETIYSIIDSCTFGKVDVRKLKMEDIDFIFLKIRAKSNGDDVLASYKCIKKNEEGKECGTNIKVNIDLNNVKTYYPENYEKNRIIMVSENAGIKFSNPSLESFKLIQREVEGTDNIFDVTDSYIYSCVECTFDGDTVQTPDIDFNEEEFKNYLNDLEGNVIDKINNFFEYMPYTGMELDVTCPKCKNRERFVLRNLEDFFV